METDIKQRGGKRVGAGRKSKHEDRTQIVFYIDRTKRERLKELHPDIANKFNEWVNELIKE